MAGKFITVLLLIIMGFALISAGAFAIGTHVITGTSLVVAGLAALVYGIITLK
jgi:hypothetical protein